MTELIFTRVKSSMQLINIRLDYNVCFCGTGQSLPAIYLRQTHKGLSYRYCII